MAYYEDLTIDQGSDVAVEIHLLEKDGSKKNLVGYNVAAKMKRNYNSDSDETYNFTAIVAYPASDGILTLTLSNTETDNLNPKKRYVYDVEISYVDSDENTIIERVLEGMVDVTPSVTR